MLPSTLDMEPSTKRQTFSSQLAVTPNTARSFRVNLISLMIILRLQPSLARCENTRLYTNYYIFINYEQRVNKKEGQSMDKNTATNMKQFLKLTWTSLILKENRKRNCLKCQFCLFFVSVNVKQGARPILSIPSKLNRFRYGIHFSISAGVTSSTHHVNRKILVAHDRNYIHKSLKYFFTLKN